jgi:hypothetical protein
VSTLALNNVINRTLLDEQFRRAVQTDPDTALDGLDLTDEERSAIRSRSFATLPPRATSPEPPPTITVIVTIVLTVRNESTGTTGHTPAARVAELTRRGDAILRMPGDRVQPIKELLALMR